jgi:hypothetical protein
MTHLKIVKPTSSAQKNTETTLNTVEVTPTEVQSWQIPEFQRELKITAKVLQISEEMRENGVIPGVITLGYLGNDIFLVDGQHRCAAFLHTELPKGYCDLRILHFQDMAEMAEEFVDLNSRLVPIKPDDILRGIESSYGPLARVRAACPFVGYSQIRRGPANPIMSMSVALRCWYGSMTPVPKQGSGSAPQLGKQLTVEESENLIKFLECAHTAWGRDAAYTGLWHALNMTLCMWVFRNLVLSVYSPKSPRLTSAQFTRCLMSLSADDHYIEWLHSRKVTKRDIAPAYGRIKTIFARRLGEELKKKVLLPAPGWATS